MFEIRVRLISKRAIMVINVEQVIGNKVIGDKYILPSVPVEVGNAYTVAVSLDRNASLPGYFRKYRVMQRRTPVISKQLACAGKRSIFNNGAKYRRIVSLDNLINDKVDVQISVVIVIKKGSHGG